MSSSPAGDFATTRWSVVVRSGEKGTPAAEVALASLCESYWFPLYSYVRRQVADVHEAQDLTQAFFTRLLEKNTFAAASPTRGRFRNFLLKSLNNFLASEWKKGQAVKRGGTLPKLSLDLDSGESRLHLEPAHELSPERLFERQWALTLLANVFERLEREFAAADKAGQFAQLKEALTGNRLDYARMAQELAMSEDAVRQAVHRLRRRYREILREEVSHTVEEPAEIDEEIQSLLDILG